MGQANRVQQAVDFQKESTAAAPTELSTLQSALHAAESAQAAAMSKREQLSQARNDLNLQIAKMNAELRQLRVAAYEQAAMSRPANFKPLCEKIHKLQDERDDHMQALSYITSFSLAQAEIDLTETNATERECTAKVLARQAMDSRKASLAAAEAAKAEDPGISINFGNAKSQRLLGQSNQAQREADNLRLQAAKQKNDAANEQQMVAPGLFNS